MTEVKHLDYQTATRQRLDIEIYSVSDLRLRVGEERLQRVFRYKFHLLLVVTHGVCGHTIDFKRVQCDPGSLLLIHPAQAHQFHFDVDWDGWMVIFKPELLLAPQMSLPASDLRLVVGLEQLPEHIALPADELQVVTAAIARMREDLRIDALPGEIHDLLRHQLYALLLRIKIHSNAGSRTPSASTNLLRFKRLQALLEENFTRWRQVADYARALGCSEKSLSRAALEVSGQSTKMLIAARVNLEAKRLLVQSDATVTWLSEHLGFDDTTSFVKFFKRETGVTPGEFRRSGQNNGS